MVPHEKDNVAEPHRSTATLAVSVAVPFAGHLHRGSYGPLQGPGASKASGGAGTSWGQCLWLCHRWTLLGCLSRGAYPNQALPEHREPPQPHTSKCPQCSKNSFSQSSLGLAGCIRCRKLSFSLLSLFSHRRGSEAAGVQNCRVQEAVAGTVLGMVEDPPVPHVTDGCGGEVMLVSQGRCPGEMLQAALRHVL